jgi:hypothetical protein
LFNRAANTAGADKFTSLLAPDAAVSREDPGRSGITIIENSALDCGITVG